MTEERRRLYRELGLTIAYYRKLKGMTQLQLSEKISKSRTFISKIEAINVDTAPSLDTLFDIAEALDLPAAALLSFTDRV